MALSLLERLTLGQGVVHDGRVYVTGHVPDAVRVRRLGPWSEVDVPALAAKAERRGRPCRALDEAIRARLSG